MAISAVGGKEKKTKQSHKYTKMSKDSYYVYFMTNKTRSVLYVGVTNDIERRVAEHKSGIVKGFTSRYKATECVMVEECGSIEDAIAREKQIKSWSREKKVELIKSYNPEMLDLSKE